MRPYVVHFRRQAGNEQQEIGHRQAKEIIIGGGVHGLVARDHHARGDVADHSGEEDYDVNHRDRQDDVQGVPAIGRALFPQEGGDRARVIFVSRICIGVDRGTQS